MPGKVWTLVLYDAQQKFPYLKRFTFDVSAKPQRFVGLDAESKIMILTDEPNPDFILHFGGDDSVRPDQEIEAAAFIAVKSFKAMGKRLTTYTLESVEQVEKPLDETEEEPEAGEPSVDAPDTSAVCDVPEADESADAPEADTADTEESGSEESASTDGEADGNKPSIPDSLFDF